MQSFPGLSICRATLALCLGLALWQPNAARAQDPVREAKQLFKQGRKAYSKGEYVKGLVSFTTALQHAPRPVILINIAQSYRKLQMPPQALFYYEWYLTAWRKQKPGVQPRFFNEVTRHIELRKKVLNLYRLGEMQYRQGTHAQALDTFRAAMRMLPWTRLRLHIAQCHHRLGQKAQAKAHIKLGLNRYRAMIARWRKQAPGKLQQDLAQLRKHVDLLQRLQRAMLPPRPPPPPPPGRLVLDGVPAGAQVAIDGQPRGEAPAAASVSLPAGEHRVAVEADGFKPWSETVKLTAGAELKQRVTLEPLPPGRSKLLLAGGISAAALAAAAEILALIYFAEADKMYLDDPAFPEHQRYVIAGHVTAGCLAAASAALFYFYWRSGETEAAPATVTLTPAPDGRGAFVGGSWRF